MEKRRKWDLPHWVTPGVFSGNFVVDEAVERISIVKPMEKQAEQSIDQETEAKMERRTDHLMLEQTETERKEYREKLEQEIQSLKEAIASWEERFKQLEKEQTKQLQYLYQVVLSLKKEWESERNEHRDH